MKTKMYLLTYVCLGLAFFQCKLPIDPATNPQYAKPSFQKINGSEIKEPVKVLKGEQVSVQFKIVNPSLIDSIKIIIEADNGIRDSSFIYTKGTFNEILQTKIVFPKSGLKNCIVTSYNLDNYSNSDTIIFSVTESLLNKKPAWIDDTIRVTSVKGRDNLFTLSSAVIDSNSDPLTFQLITSVSSTHYTITGTTISVAKAADTGVYIFKIIASDGALTDTCNIRWRIMLTQGTVVIKNDAGQTLKNKPVTIDVLKNDSISAGELVLTSISTGKLGKAKINSNKLIYTPDYGKTGIDTLIYKVNNKDSGRVVITITQAAINSAPTFTAPETLIVLQEAVLTTKQYSATDKDAGNSVVLSLVPTTGIPIPSWVSATGSVDNITLSFTPDYTIATTAASSVTTILSLKATDGTDSTILKIKVTVNNVNRKPQFTKAPAASVTSPTGDTMKITLDGSDPDGDSVTFSQAGTMAGLTFNQATRMLLWYIPRDKYTFNNSVNITLRVSDGKLYSDSTFKVVIDVHTWKLRNSNIPPRTQNYSPGILIAAEGAEKVYYLTYNTAVNVLRSSDGGISFDNQPFSTFGSSIYTPYFFESRIGKLFIAGAAFQWCFYAEVSTSSATVIDSQGIGMPRSFAVNSAGSLSLFSTIGMHSSTPSLYIKSGSLDTTYDFPTNFKSLSAGSSYVWGLSSDSGVSYLQNVNASLPSKGFTFTKNQTYLEKIVHDGNNGDTAFAFKDSSKDLGKAAISDPYFTFTTLSIPSYIAGVMMLNTSLGWLWTTDGEVYFTNNGFLTYYKEIFPDNNGAAVKIDYVFKSTDNTTVYAASKNATNVVTLFRY